jgi:hypothetical protein
VKADKIRAIGCKFQIQLQTLDEYLNAGLSVGASYDRNLVISRPVQN